MPDREPVVGIINRTSRQLMFSFSGMGYGGGPLPPGKVTYIPSTLIESIEIKDRPSPVGSLDESTELRWAGNWLDDAPETEEREMVLLAMLLTVCTLDTNGTEICRDQYGISKKCTVEQLTETTSVRRCVIYPRPADTCDTCG